MKRIILILFCCKLSLNLCFGQNWILLQDAMIDGSKIFNINNNRILYFQTFGFTGAPFINCNDTTIYRGYKINNLTNSTYKFLNPHICFDYILSESCIFSLSKVFDISNSDSSFSIYYENYYSGSNCGPPLIKRIITSTGYSTHGDSVTAKVIRISPFNDNKIFSVINDLLYKSSDRGQNWSYVSGTPGNLKDVIFNHYDSNYVYIISSQNQFTMLISTNGGTSFNITANNFSSSSTLYLKEKDTLYTFNGSNLYRSDNKGLDWSFVGTGAGNFNCLEFHPTLKNICYAGFGNLGLFVSTNSGVNFTVYNNTFSPDNFVLGILKAKPDLDSIYVVTRNGVYLTYDQYVTKITLISTVTPVNYSLFQNYPNPFNPNTIINYELRITNFVNLTVYDLLGHEVARLVNEKQSPETYQVEFDGKGLPTGVYFYRFTAGEFTDVKRMMLIK